MKESQLGCIPSHWTLVELGQVCFLRHEVVMNNEDSKLCYIGLEHVDSKNEYSIKSGFISEVKGFKCKFYPNDILYSKFSSKLYKTVLSAFEGICSTEILIISCTKLILPEFFYCLTHTQAFLDHIAKITVPVITRKISWMSLASFEFKLPTIAEQHSIAKVLQTVLSTKEICLKEKDLERERKAALVAYLNNNAENSKIQSIHSDNDLKINLHKDEIQQKIETLIKTCDAKIQSIEEEIILLDEFFQAIAEQFMSGQLSVLSMLE